MARTYKRDSRGRFAGGGGGSGSGAGKKSGGGGKGQSRQQIINAKKNAINKHLRATKQTAGLNRDAAKVRYMNSQNATAYAGNKFMGKGNKAAKRAAAVTARSAQAARAKQFSSKSAKNTAARAKYKEAASKFRSMEKMAAGARKNNPSHAPFWNRKAGGAKSGLTRITNRLSGKTKSRKRG